MKKKQKEEMKKKERQKKNNKKKKKEVLRSSQLFLHKICLIVFIILMGFSLLLLCFEVSVLDVWR